MAASHSSRILKRGFLWTVALVLNNWGSCQAPPHELVVDRAKFSILALRETAERETDLGSFDSANLHLAKASELAKSNQEFETAATLDVRRVQVLIKLNKIDEAERTLDWAAAHSTDHLVPFIQHCRGLVADASGRSEDAIDPLKSSIKEFRAKHRNAMAANVMITLALVYYHLRKLESAHQLYSEAGTIASPKDMHLCVGNIGNIFFEQGDFANAEASYSLAAAWAEGRDQSSRALWLANLASAQCQQQKWSEAKVSIDKVLRLDPKMLGPFGSAVALINRGRIETANKNYAAAKMALEEVLNSNKRHLKAMLDANCALADLYVEMKQPEAARERFEAALSLAAQTPTELREDENKLSYISSLVNVHQQYVDFLYKRGERKEAFLVAESSRARLLHERLNVPMAPEHRHTIEEYKAAAKASGSTFLEYWIGPERSYVWVIRDRQFLTFVLPPASDIRDSVERYRRAVENTNPSQSDEAGAHLFHMLLGQHQGLLTPTGRYIMVLDGPLHALNFETLPISSDNIAPKNGSRSRLIPVPGPAASLELGGASANGERQEPAKKHYWIEDATVAVTPSLDLLIASHRQHKRTVPSLLALGDATEWTPEFPKLMHAGEEIKQIARRFGPGRETIFTGNQATRGAYQGSKPEQFPFIHFAAHAETDRNSPLDSSIVLSMENGENGSGKLSVKQVLKTPVHAEVVTISACHSAGARAYAGEGLVGFAWAFLRSGARAVVAGLWDVSDDSSPKVMDELYAGLVGAKMSPMDALRKAKLKLLKGGGKYARPYYWGPFQLYLGELPKRR